MVSHTFLPLFLAPLCFVFDRHGIREHVKVRNSAYDLHATRAVVRQVPRIGRNSVLHARLLGSCIGSACAVQLEQYVVVAGEQAQLVVELLRAAVAPNVERLQVVLLELVPVEVVPQPERGLGHVLRVGRKHRIDVRKELGGGEELSLLQRFGDHPKDLGGRGAGGEDRWGGRVGKGGVG